MKRGGKEWEGEKEREGAKGDEDKASDVRKKFYSCPWSELNKEDDVNTIDSSG
jgi:hypothetical protein